jgi:CRP-like cAMP-binding protein
MKKYLDVLSKSVLFKGTEDNILAMLSCMSARKAIYDKNEYIFMEGDDTHTVGIVLTGRILIVKDDFWGNRSILSEIVSGEIFGESFSYTDKAFTAPVSALAVEKTEVLLIDYAKLITTCSSNCYFHNQVIMNLINILTKKNIMLTHKIVCVTKKTTREKLLFYLSAQAKRAKSNCFTISFNRQELADFLAVDRSAMSTELGKMRDEKLLEFHKNMFLLKNVKSV